MPSRLYFNSSPYSFQGAKLMPYSANPNSVYEHQTQHFQQYPYQNHQHQYAGQHQYRTSQQMQQYYTAYQYHQYQMALIQYYNQNYTRNQYHQSNQFQISASPQPHQPQPQQQQQQLVPALKANPPEVYHKIPEFNTIRKKLPLHDTWSKNSKPKLALMDRSKSVSVEKQQKEQEANSKSLKAITTKIVELTEIKKKMEKLDEIAVKSQQKNNVDKSDLSKIDKQLKIELLKQLSKKNEYNVYMNSFPFNNSVNNSSTDESGLGDIDIKSKSSSSHFSHSEPETQSEPDALILKPEINDNNNPQVLASLVEPLAEIKTVDTLPIPVTPTTTTSTNTTTEMLAKPEPEPSKLVIKQKFKFLGIFNANPEEYILQYGNELIPSIFSDKKSSTYTPPSLPTANLEHYAHGKLLSA